MKPLLLVIVVIVLGFLAYSCSSTCAVYPRPGGYSYEQPAEKGK